jgi:hypothetical protein
MTFEQIATVLLAAVRTEKYRGEAVTREGTRADEHVKSLANSSF